MKIIYKQLAAALYESLSQEGAVHDTVIKRFVRIIREKRLESHFDEIAASFVRLAKERQRLRDVTVIVADKHHATVDVLDAVRKGLDTGYEYTITVAEDPKMIGGIVVQNGDTLLDASVKRKLEKLYEAMII